MHLLHDLLLFCQLDGRCPRGARAAGSVYAVVLRLFPALKRLILANKLDIDLD